MIEEMNKTTHKCTVYGHTTDRVFMRHMTYSGVGISVVGVLNHGAFIAAMRRLCPREGSDYDSRFAGTHVGQSTSRAGRKNEEVKTAVKPQIL